MPIELWYRVKLNVLVEYYFKWIYIISCNAVRLPSKVYYLADIVEKLCYSQVIVVWSGLFVIYIASSRSGWSLYLLLPWLWSCWPCRADHQRMARSKLIKIYYDLLVVCMSFRNIRRTLIRCYWGRSQAEWSLQVLRWGARPICSRHNTVRTGCIVWYSVSCYWHRFIMLFALRIARTLIFLQAKIRMSANRRYYIIYIEHALFSILYLGV